MRRRWILGCVVLLLAGSLLRAQSPPELWVYDSTNLLVDQNVVQARKLWQRAAAAGYDHVLLADSKFNRLSEMPSHYLDNCRKIKQLAAELKLQIVPALFSIGYSNDLLSQDPNLAEGLPVKDQPFVVSGGILRALEDPPLELGRMSFHDPNVSVEGSEASVHNSQGHARIVFHLPVVPFRCYHVSVQIKTEDFHGEPEIKVIAGNSQLQWQSVHVDRSQNWKQCDVVFNSLDHRDANVYFGFWSDVKGALSWRNWSIESSALVNVLRRDGTPVVVKDAATGKPLTEGTDLDAIADAKLGRTPYAGEYKAYHSPPEIHTHLPEGTRVLISWYHPAIIYDEQVPICISEPRTMQLLADQARRMKALWDAPLYMMSHDEYRVCNWDQCCQDRNQTPGKMLAENLRACTKLLEPSGAAVWSDMFDPFHNAVKGPYYLVNGPWLGSWEGLGKDVLVVNWNYDKRDASLKFFADRGNAQLIAGYYDGDLTALRDWMVSAAKVQGVRGYMYTTWAHNYSQLEKFAQIVRGK